LELKKDHQKNFQVQHVLNAQSYSLSVPISSYVGKAFLEGEDAEQGVCVVLLKNVFPLALDGFFVIQREKYTLHPVQQDDGKWLGTKLSSPLLLSEVSFFYFFNFFFLFFLFPLLIC